MFAVLPVCVCCANDSLLPDEKVCQSHSNSDGLILTSQLADLGSDQSTNASYFMELGYNSRFRKLIPNSGVTHLYDL